MSRQRVFACRRQTGIMLLAVPAVLAGWSGRMVAAPPRCEVLPLAGNRTSPRVLGEEVACWNHGGDAEGNRIELQTALRPGAGRAETAFTQFADSPVFVVAKSNRAHVRWSVVRQLAAE